MKESDATHLEMLKLEKVIEMHSDSIGQFHLPNTNKLYYVENKECGDGDTMLFWKVGNCGYTPNLNEAIALEADNQIIKDIVREQKMGVNKYRLWEINYLRKVAIISVNNEMIDYDKEIKL